MYSALSAGSFGTACTAPLVSKFSHLPEPHAAPAGPAFPGSPASAEGGPVGHGAGSGRQGALRPPLPGAAEPARWVFLSPSRALSSRPHIRVWSAAAVSVGAGASGAGPGAVNGGGGRRSGGCAQPRDPETLEAKPCNFPGSAAAPGAWTDGEAEAESLG